MTTLENLITDTLAKNNCTMQMYMYIRKSYADSLKVEIPASLKDRYVKLILEDVRLKTQLDDAIHQYNENILFVNSLN